MYLFHSVFGSSILEKKEEKIEIQKQIHKDNKINNKSLCALI